MTTETNKAIDTKEILKHALACVELKIDLNKLASVIIDDVIEKALDAVVAKSDNKFDDAAKAMIWPILEKEVKELIAVKVVVLEAEIKKKIDELKGSVA